MSDCEIDFGKKKKDKKEKKEKMKEGSDDEMDFGKKKKKEKKDKKEKGDGAEKEVDMVETEFEQGELWEYDELLRRLHDTIEEKTGALNIKDKFTMKPPQVVRAGAKKTSWANFFTCCDTLNRTPEHCASYVYAELGCDGTFAGEGQFILKGRFFPRNIESLLRRYIKEFVTCGMCRSSSTTLVKDQATRLTTMNCSNCGASRSCAQIKSGFHAVAKGERKKAKMAGDKLQIVG